jgi:hypothetical protein
LRVEIAGEPGRVGEGVVALSHHCAAPQESDASGRNEGSDKSTCSEFDVEQGQGQGRAPTSRTQAAKAFVMGHFLYYYVRSLFPTRREFDYRWEWNPWTYAKKLAALEETGKNRSKHKQNYPYPLIVIFYCWCARAAPKRDSHSRSSSHSHTHAHTCHGQHGLAMWCAQGGLISGHRGGGDHHAVWV